MCNLRLVKLETQWLSLKDTVLAESQGGIGDDDFLSETLDDAINLCDDTNGIWSDGFAIQLIFISRFGVDEGVDSVREHLSTLRMQADDSVGFGTEYASLQ